MDKQKCLYCSERKRCQSDYKSWIFLVIGLIATVSIRFVTFLMHVEPLYGKIAWYVGVLGFLVFFLYKFRVLKNRAKLLKKQNILMKLNGQEVLTKQDYALIAGIVCSLSSIKERINFFFIFFFSAIALIVAIYVDLFK